MKTALFLALGLGSIVHALEVHEWGTFTVLSGSNGSQVPWYASANELAQLPGFVSQDYSSKTGYAQIRMETPVIYFYPEEKMKVSVEVTFENGSVTETFPHSHGGKMEISPTSGINIGGKWSGTLHPPTDPNALAEIPVIPEMKNPEPYAAAREVPEAWIFESELKEIPNLKVQPHFPQMEKFIFYRGAGNGYVPTQATMQGDDVTVTNNSSEVIPYAVVLRVRGGKAAWLPISKIPAMNHSSLSVPKAERPLDEVEYELVGVWKKALSANGLTPAEASAMVETWRKTWFRESGDRILTLVPRKVIDAMLPLKITPEPEKTERVFVARIEMISQEREETIIKLLNTNSPPSEKELERFQALEIGRFGNGALEVAARLHKNRMIQKFHALKQLGDNGKTSAR